MVEVIALPCINDKGVDSSLSHHFGRSPYYAFVTVEGDSIEKVKVIKVDFEDHAVGELPKLMKEQGADVIITYGMGPKAVDFLKSFGIRVILGVSGTVKEVVEKYLKNELEPVENWEEDEEFSHHHKK